MYQRIVAALMLCMLALPVAGTLGGCKGGILASSEDQRVSREKLVYAAMESETVALRAIAVAVRAGAIKPDTAAALGARLDEAHALLLQAKTSVASGGDGEPQLGAATAIIADVNSQTGGSAGGGAQ